MFPIRTVSSLTGVNAITLRAWERRHGIVEPVRTPSGHRLYRQADVDRIQRVLALLATGLPISQARRSLGEPEGRRRATRVDPWQAHRERVVGAVARFDEDSLDNIYNAALALHPIQTVTARLLLPVLRILGERWANREGGITEEHFFSAYLRNKLGARIHHRGRQAGRPRVLSACLPGEQHEIGLMLFTLVAHERGLDTVFLAANTPIEDLPRAAKRANCDAIVLSATLPPAVTVLEAALPALVAAAPVPVFVGGRASVAARDAIVAAGAQVLGADIDAGAKRLSMRLEAAARLKR
jgi:DNA-binding transcriptional MerR regulator/methylmalonyl-CoA mutase cobalamin-binding subunit